jgi:hypothetical protein
MRRFFLLAVLIGLFGCNDGNFEVPSFEFIETVENCGSYVLYRTNSDDTEALIVTLSESNLPEMETTTEVDIDTDNVIYRIFSESITPATYFCQSIPPAEPSVIKEWSGVAGSNNYIEIITTEVLDDSNMITGYKHLIVLHNMVLQNGEDTIVYETYNFGSVTIDL